MAAFTHLLMVDWATAESFARRPRFPEHHLVVRLDRQEEPQIRKGIAGWDELATALAGC